jgi:DNA repair exonuclease SbcCD ATPase subunit
MAKGNQDASELVNAAQALENELLKLEALSKSVRKLRLSSEKTITRAAKELSEALSLQGGLAEGLQALAASMAQMQTRQSAALEPLAAFASELQQRMLKLREHMDGFGALGKAAGEVSSLLQSEDQERSAVLAQADAQLTKIADGARALFDAAHADDFPEVAREADALKQRVAALRRRLDGKA